jgi:Immunoglobulin domain
LSKTVAPEIVPFNFGDSPLNAGDAAQTQCVALKGDTPLNISWTFHGDTSFQTGVTTVRVGPRGSALMIDSINSGHSGTYTCTAQNLAGSATYSAVLVVNGLFHAETFHSAPPIPHNPGSSVERWAKRNRTQNIWNISTDIN